MGIDAVAILHPKDPKKIRAHIDPHEPGTLLVPLEDGTILFHSFMRFGSLENEPGTVRQWLEQTFGKDLPLVHDDPRGVLVFPDICEPRAQKYDALVKEVESAGFWVPLDDSATAVGHAEKARATQKAARDSFNESSASFLAKIEDLMKRNVDPSAPEAQALLGELGALTGGFVIREGVAVRCVLVKRKTPLVVREQVNEVATLPDSSTAIFTVDMGDLDDFSWRLAQYYSHWLDEHVDKRGVPTFPSDAFKRVRLAKSYEDALELLGEKVTFIRPKGSDEREVERKAKLDAVLGPAKKKKKKAKTSPKRPTPKAKAKTKTRSKSKPKAKTRASSKVKRRKRN
jgi:hypothetical protein